VFHIEQLCMAGAGIAGISCMHEWLVFASPSVSGLILVSIIQYV
jgi:hypothetical protein